MTLHSAKGLEFGTVFLPGWEEGLFPHQRALDEKGRAGLEEERRLAYVGITRAKRRAYISFAQNRRVHNLWQNALPSRFIDELPEALCRSGPHDQQPMAAMASAAMAPAASTNAKPFANTYATPGWQRAQERWAQGRRRCARRRRFIEGEMVARETEGPALHRGRPRLPPEIRLWPHHPRRRQQAHHRLRQGRRKARARLVSSSGHKPLPTVSNQSSEGETCRLQQRVRIMSIIGAMENASSLCSPLRRWPGATRPFVPCFRARTSMPPVHLLSQHLLPVGLPLLLFRPQIRPGHHPEAAPRPSPRPSTAASLAPHLRRQCHLYRLVQGQLLPRRARTDQGRQSALASNSIMSASISASQLRRGPAGCRICRCRRPFHAAAHDQVRRGNHAHHRNDAHRRPGRCGLRRGDCRGRSGA